MFAQKDPVDNSPVLVQVTSRRRTMLTQFPDAYMRYQSAWKVVWSYVAILFHIGSDDSE